MPRYVAACAARDWHLELYNKKTGEVLRRQFRCRSWRDEGPCRESRFLEDRERVLAALMGCGPTGPVDPTHVVYFLLTDKPTTENPWRASKRAMDRFRKRLTRRFRKFRGVDTGEQFSVSGRGHYNMVLVSAALAAALRNDYLATVQILKAMAVESGWGWFIGTPEVARDLEAVAGYVAKLSSGKAAVLAGEITKPSQAPVNAPLHFRRLRSSRGFLPPRRKNPELTGKLVFAPLPKERSDVSLAINVQSSTSPSLPFPAARPAIVFYVAKPGDFAIAQSPSNVRAHGGMNLVRAGPTV